MRVICVPVAARPECEAALETTFAIAKKIGSDVVGCHVQPTPLEPGDWNMADLWTMKGTAWPTGDAADETRATQDAKNLFEAVVQRNGFDLSEEPGTRERPKAHWQTRTGAPPDLMPVLGAASDLLVVSRAPERGGHKAWLVLVSALLDSGAPVLVLPQRKVDVSARRIAIAWNRGRMETNALHATLPILKAAEDVVFLTVGEERRSGPTSEDMIRFLACHGVAARARFVERPSAGVGSALVETAAAEGADLLLAGAYTRGRFRQLVFGGVTEHLLTKSDFPVLTMHD